MVLQKLKKALPYHLSDSTAILAEATPIYVFFETAVSRMSADASQNARLSILGMTYLGLGFVYGKGRDLWRNAFQVNNYDTERRKQFHDALYAASFNALLSPPLYYLTGAKTTTEILTATALSVGFGMLNGGPVGYSIDIFRDLTGVQPSERVPSSLKRRPALKKGLAAALVGASIGLTSLLYHYSLPQMEGETAVAQQVSSLEQQLEQK